MRDEEATELLLQRMTAAWEDDPAPRPALYRATLDLPPREAPVVWACTVVLRVTFTTLLAICSDQPEIPLTATR